jgi:hypothetical protein
MNLKSKFGLRGRILKITPSSVYQESVYTQDILIELENSVKLRVYDAKMRCEEKDLGKVKNLHVIADNISSIKKYEVIEPYIAPFKLMGTHSMHTDPISTNAVISGPLEEIIFLEDDSRLSYGIVNIGVGKVALRLFKEQLDEFKEGDYIHVDSAALYLIGIEN